MMFFIQKPIITAISLAFVSKFYFFKKWFLIDKYPCFKTKHLTAKDMCSLFKHVKHILNMCLNCENVSFAVKCFVYIAYNIIQTEKNKKINEVK